MQTHHTPSCRAIIFDMDGVIVDSEPIHARAFEDIFSDLGFGENHGIHFPDYYGRTDRLVWEVFLDRHTVDCTLESLIERKQKRFFDILRATKPIFEPIPDLVERLAARYPLAVASGSSHAVIDEVLAIGSLRSHFNAVVSSHDVARGKPAPDVFLRAAECLGIDPRDCVVIEDAPAGVAAARTAGMQVIAITNSVPADQLDQAHRIVGNYEELACALPTPIN